jgi:hypothetical protein
MRNRIRRARLTNLNGLLSGGPAACPSLREGARLFLGNEIRPLNILHWSDPEVDTDASECRLFHLHRSNLPFRIVRRPGQNGVGLHCPANARFRRSRTFAVAAL